MSEKKSYTFKQYVGALLCDLPYYLATFLQSNGWVSARNRNDRLEWDSNGVAVKLVDDGAVIYMLVCARFPRPRSGTSCKKHFNAGRLLEKQTSVRLIILPFLSSIPFRGPERLPLLRAVIESIHSQLDADVECLIIEQSPRRELNTSPRRTLPSFTTFLR